MTIEEYYEDFKQNLLAEAGTSGEMLTNTFVDKVCGIVSEQGSMPDAEQVNYKFTQPQRGIAVDAWARDSERGHLTLLIADFRNADAIETITNMDIEKTLKRLDRFVEACAKKTFVEALEDSDPVVPLARHLLEQRGNIQSIDFILLTDARISSRVKEIKPSEYKIENAQKCEVWDIQRLYELESSGRERETIEVDFTEYAENGIECLCASTGEASLKSYLLVLPGQVLANLYDKYGERLFEQNVRTFLQFRGKVNKGIRNTIVQQPAMFFAYNNGLSATGEAVETSPSGNRILKITNLQIVNGGQTTASIYTAWRNEKADLKDIFVQVKLSVVESEKVNDIVPRISEYANTQNKVNAADFFSNHPFHLRIEEFSRRFWAPAIDGGTRQTHWFYERARGQFVNAQAKLTPAKAKEFLLQNPKNQMFTKTDLAKYYLTFWKMPHLVSKGAQKAFAGASGSEGFVSIITREWDKKDKSGENISINELWFKEMVARAILFKALDKTLAEPLKQRNYNSYKAVIVTYTLALFSHALDRENKSFDFEKIWKTQKTPDEILVILQKIAMMITDYFQSKPTHVGEWAKKESCWQEIQILTVELGDEVEAFCLHADDKISKIKAGKRGQRGINAINDMQRVVEKGEAYWWKLRGWSESHRIFSPMEMGILDVACKISRGKIPSDKQAKILLRAEKRAIDDGFFVE
jgi:hypothetical protein